MPQSSSWAAARLSLDTLFDDALSYCADHLPAETVHSGGEQRSVAISLLGDQRGDAEWNCSSAAAIRLGVFSKAELASSHRQSA